MITRVAAAAIGLAVLLPAIIFGGHVAVEVIAPAVMILCWSEYAAMAFPEDRAVSWAVLCLGGFVPYLVVLYGPEQLTSLAMAMVVLCTMILVTLRPLPLSSAADRVGRYVLGMGWVGFLLFLPLLRRLEHGLAWIFLVLAISWCCDTGGYFAGRAFGRTPLYPTVSPKKTWGGGGKKASLFRLFCEPMSPHAAS